MKKTVEETSSTNAADRAGRLPDEERRRLLHKLVVVAAVAPVATLLLSGKTARANGT